MRKFIYVFLIVLTMSFALSGCGSGSSSYQENHQREVERVRDQLYKKGSDGLWYLK